MTREDIKKEALDFSKRKYGEEYQYPIAKRQACCWGFVNGSERRINSVWHKDLKIGEPKKPILVRFKNGLFHLCEDIRELKGIESEVEMFAYLEDLIPNTEDLS